MEKLTPNPESLRVEAFAATAEPREDAGTAANALRTPLCDPPTVGPHC
ncbi:MAG TPA: hypothetical protein VF092_06530 [Longimicrobium sp.]